MDSKKEKIASIKPENPSAATIVGGGGNIK